jgi:hypothetical protein
MGGCQEAGMRLLLHGSANDMCGTRLDTLDTPIPVHHCRW